MNIIIADKFQAWSRDELSRLGCNVTFEAGLKDGALAKVVRKTQCNVLVVRSTRVDESILTAGDRLSLVVRAGAGYDTIDVEAASRQSILVANCPGRNAVAVAELTMALILALDRRIVDNTVDLRNGVWNKKEYSQARGLKGRVLGIIGLGQIGRAVARRAKAFEMPIVAWGRSMTNEDADELGIRRCGSPSDVATCCDVLSIHLASSDDTRGMINAELLGHLKSGSYVINTARHDVMDYEALRKIAAERNLRVGLDVLPAEPSGGSGSIADSIFDLNSVVYGTHHIGASTDEAQDAIAKETVRIISTFKSTGRVLNCVNLRDASAAGWCLRVRHINRPGVLAHVLGELSRAGINVEEMANSITTRAEAACAQIYIDAKPQQDLLDRICAGSENILAADLYADPKT